LLWGDTEFINLILKKEHVLRLMMDIENLIKFSQVNNNNNSNNNNNKYSYEDINMLFYNVI